MPESLENSTSTQREGSKQFGRIVAGLIVLTGLFLVGTIIYHYSQRSPVGVDDQVKTAQAQQDVIMLADAIVKFGNATGEFPESFEKLVPEYLAAVPSDPYSRPYKLIDNGPDQIFVYYLGKDGRFKGMVERDVDIGRRIVRQRDTFSIGE